MKEDGYDFGKGNIMETNAAGVVISPQTIGTLLQGKGLRVPLSQRSYRWEEEHVADLYNDMDGAITDDSEEYFIGSIVGICTRGTIYIYDGQQRLATTMILIAAIRDYFCRKQDGETATEVERESLISKDRRTGAMSPHFALNAEDQEFFLNRVLLRPDAAERRAAEPLRESHKRIDAAASFAANFVSASIAKGLSPDKAVNQMHAWLDFIKDSLRVIWVQVSDERNAFTIFETMNDRGLRLSAADLLKNRLYGMGGDRQDEIIQKWQSMTAVLETIEDESENVVEYVRCYWIISHGPTRTKALYDEIKKEAVNKAKAVALASDLELVAQDYAAILLSSHEKLASRGPNVRTKIEVLRQLGVTQVRPLLLAAFRKFSRAEFAKLLDACVSWSVRTLLSGVPSGTLEGFYSRNAFHVTNGKIKTTAEVKEEMAEIIPNDERFQLAVSSANVTKQHLSRYYLLAMQRCADGVKEPQYIPNSGQEVTLEHILPKNPGQEWGHLSTEEQKSFLNRLGNQVLLPATVNSKIGNAAYAIKKTALANSQFSLTHETATHAQWGTHEIVARQKRLAELAVKTWPAP